eukprot:jgi/Phyca11/16207/fgenesh1_pg.PHYCAscaffold_18_\
MPSSSDSDDDRRKGKKNKEFHINSSGNPVHWDGENWPFYKKAMTVAFQRDLLEQIATGKVKEDDQWSQDEKDEHTKKQAKIQMLIMGSLKTTLAQQLMDQKNGTDMWAELCKTYEGRNNDATKAQKVYRLQGELHRTHLRANGDVRAHLYSMFRIRNELAELGLKKQGHASGNQKGGNNKSAGDVPKKKTPKTDIECFNCGVKGHYKSNCPDLEEKSNTKKSAQAKMARTGKKPVEKAASRKADEVVDHVHKRDVVVGEVVKRVAKNYDPSRWYFDSGTNAHIVTNKEYFTVLNSMEDSDWNPTISGCADRYGSSFKTKVNKWLQTFTEYVEAGHFDDDSDSEEASQQAEFDADSVREDSNVDMVSVAESEDLDAEKAAQWDRMVQNSVLPTFDGEVSSTPSSKLPDDDQQVWQDMLENIETQEGESEVNTEEREHDDYHDGDHEDRDHGDVDDAQGTSDADARATQNEESVEDEESVDYEHNEVASHVTDLVSVSENIVDDENGYDFLFDPSDEHEAECVSDMNDEVDDPPRQLEQNSARNDVLGFPQQMLVGRVHPRDEEVRRTQDRKRTKFTYNGHASSMVLR